MVEIIDYKDKVAKERKKDKIKENIEKYDTHTTANSTFERDQLNQKLTKEEDALFDQAMEDIKYNILEKDLKTPGHIYWSVSETLQILSKFAESAEGAGAKMMLILPEGRNALQKEFNIKTIKLIPNKIIGAKERYRCAILVQ
tara:strand:+ start:570 stop:998 length:429 start_codon:yes stop_codon:yes gene_type:complete